MNSHTEIPAAAITAFQCINCGLSLNGNEERTLLCADCGDTTTDWQTQTNACRSVTVKRADVSLTKSVVTESNVPCFEYTISSTRSCQVKFHIHDRLPIRNSGELPEPPADDDRSYTTVDATWWVPPRGEITFRRELPNLGKDRGLADDELRIDALPRLTVVRPESDRSHDHVVWNDVMENGDHPEPVSDDATVLAALPAYNENGSIGDIVSRAKEHADAVLVVDDGSDDDTSARAWEAGAFVHEHESNSGYGAALQTIFSKAHEVDTDHLVILDSDGQHDTTDIPRLVAKQQSTGADIVIANRFGEGADTEMPQYRWFGLSVINRLTHLGVGSGRSSLDITDSQSGFRAYNQRAIRSLVADDRIGERMEISTDILYHAKLQGYDVAEVGSTIEYDVEEASSVNPVKHGFMLVRNLLPMIERERPLLVLGVPGFLLAALGTGVGISLFEQINLADGLGFLAITFTIMVALAGVFSCTAGVMLHTLHRFHEYSD